MRLVVGDMKPERRLCIQEDGDGDDERINYEEMTPFTPEAFDAAIQSKKAQVFYTTDIRKALEHAKLENQYHIYIPRRETQWIEKLQRQARANAQKRR